MISGLFYKPDKEIQTFNAINEIVSMLRLTTAQLQNSETTVNIRCDCCGICPNSDNMFSSHDCGSEFAKIKGYQGEFKQVIFNLIYNSIDAINENKAKGNITQGLIDVFIKCNDDNIIIKITDNGGGVPDEIADNIFDPYFSTKEEGKGTGIGLYMSKIIIENHMNGTISLENEKKDGAAFFIEMPIEKNK